MNEESKCSTRLLLDSPTKEDAFGSHARVANAIAELIKNESGGKSIALTGSWGSGKSSVVDMLKDQVDTNTELFVFDAWAHEGDPLRRTFLEQLIDSLIKNKWVNEEKWKEEKQKISKKLIEQKVDSTPILTGIGKIFVFLFFVLFPIGLILLSLTGSENIAWWIPTIGLVLSLLPLIVYIFYKIIKCFKSENDEKDDVIPLLFNQSKTTTISETITTPDPTSIEFQSWFEKLLGDSKIGIEDRKLLIVIDNLDRIDTKGALEIWATMRTFFDFDPKNGTKWIENLWLLVPFDQMAITRLWPTEDEKSVNEIDVNEINSNRTDTNGQLIHSFKDKSFQITFNVAPPVMSDWKEYLLNQLREAFPDHDRADFHKIYRLYRLRGFKEEKLPTPRDLKIFVNQIGALHRQWYDDIPLEIQALYVLLSRNDYNFEKMLVESNLLTLNEKLLVDNDYLKYLAALHFNVDIEKSLQVLMGKPIEKALSTGNMDSIKEQTNLLGFPQVCEHVISERYLEWSSSQPHTIFMAANVLSKIEHEHEPSLEGAWDLLIKGTENAQFLHLLDKTIGTGISQLFMRKPNDSFAQHIIEITNSSIQDLSEEDKTINTETIGKWLDGIYIVFTVLLENKQHSIINEHFSVNCSAPTYIEIISKLSNRPECSEIKQFFKTSVEPTEVIGEITNIANEGRFNDNYYEVVKNMLIIDQDWTWDSFITALNVRLQTIIDKPSEMKNNLEALLQLEKEGIEQATNHLANLTNQGYLFHHFHRIDASNDVKAKALFMIPFLKIVPTGTIQGNIGHSGAGLNLFNKISSDPTKQQEVVNNFADLSIEYSLIDTLIELPSNAPNTSNFVYATMNVISKENEILGEKLISRDFNTKFSKMYSIVLSTKHSEKLTYFLIDGLKNIDKNKWLSELQNEGDLLELLFEFIKLGNKPDLSRNFSDALLEHAKHLIVNNIEFEPSKGEKLYEALNEYAKIVFLKNLLDFIIDSENATDHVLNVYGKLLSGCDILTKKADNLVLKGFKSFIGRKTIIELKWLNEVILNCPDILDNCDISSKEDFKDRIIELYNSDEIKDDIRNLIDPLADQIGIKFLKSEENID